MIYTSKEINNKYLKGNFDEYPRWVRSVFYPAFFEVGNDWLVWQYWDRGLLEGYTGGEKYIDLDVLHRGKEIVDLMVD